MSAGIPKRVSTTESRGVRWLLTALALGFMGLFLVLPLAAVFVEALRGGWQAYWDALKEPDALAAIRLTLLTAAIAVPMNLVFGVAAACLGATRWQTFWRVIFPAIAPALLTGFAMAFARAVGEYGSVIFIAGNMPMVSEITPLIIIGKLEQYDYAGATAVASVMLLISFILLLIINGLQAWGRRRYGGTA